MPTEASHLPTVTLSDLPSASGSFDDLQAFAATLDAHAIWGSSERVAAISESVLDRLGGHLRCTSPTKLRTAIFRLAEASRSLSPPALSRHPLGPGGEQTSALADTAWGVLSRLRRCLIEGPRYDTLVTHAAETLAAQVPTASTYERRDACLDLMEAICSLDTPVPGASLHARLNDALDGLAQWPSSDGELGLDVTLGVAGSYTASRSVVPRIAVELIWGNDEPMIQAAWDSAKLIDALASSVDHVYLIGCWPQTAWDCSSPTSLFTTGEVDLQNLIINSNRGSERAFRTSSPDVEIPRRLISRLLARAEFTHRHQTWSLRCITVEPAASGWCRLDSHELR